MKSFDEVVDDLFSPAEPVCKHDVIVKLEPIILKRSKVHLEDRHKFLHDYYAYQKLLHTPFYGRDVQEPVVKICKRILEKPNRFHLVKELERYTRTIINLLKFSKGWGVIEDKDTKQKFARKSIDCEISNLSCLTCDEQVLLTATLNEWYNHQRDILAKKKATREEKRKERFRKELSDLYEGY